MAKPRDSYPETATNAARKEAPEGDGEAAVRRALRENGDDLAAVIESADELGDVLTTAILVVASADEAELDHITESTANLVHAADGLSTPEAAALAGSVGENADDLSAALDTVLDLQREGHLDDLVAVATAFSESLSPAEVEELAGMLEADGSDIVAALDLVLDLQREGQLEDLLGLARTISALEVEPEAVAGMNDALAALGETQRDPEPVGFLGLLGTLRSRDARAGLGYLVALLKALGRRTRDR